MRVNIIPPVTNCCQREEIAIKFIPFCITVIIRAPIPVPAKFPSPPCRAAPPIITIAIASKGKLAPTIGEAVSNLAV